MSFYETVAEKKIINLLVMQTLCHVILNRIPFTVNVVVKTLGDPLF